MVTLVKAVREKDLAAKLALWLITPPNIIGLPVPRKNEE